MERREQEVAGTIAGEDSAGAVPAVGGRAEPPHEHPRLRIPEPGNGLRPVVPFGVPLRLQPGRLLAPRHETRTLPARDDLVVDRFQLMTRGQAPAYASCGSGRPG